MYFALTTVTQSFHAAEVPWRCTVQWCRWTQPMTPYAT